MKTCTSCGKEWPDEFRLCPADGSSLRSAASPDELVDTVIADRYVILKKLGQGGMGTVYLGEHVKMGQRAAIKVISRHLASDPAAIARFNREARNAAQIRHPNVCMVHDFGETPDGLIYMAMEFIEGDALADILHREGRMPLQRAADILMQCCDALQAAHDLDIVHRDIKPENIMITRGRDGSDVVKVVDFGIAKAVATESGQTVTQTGFIVGTPDYMSPDQVSGEILDGRSDIYSLAVVFYRMVTGVLPFKTETPHDALMARLAGIPISLAEAVPTAGFPQQLQEALSKALAQKREHRYATSLEFGRAIMAAARDVAADLPTTVAAAETYKLPTPQPVAKPAAGRPRTPDTPQPRPSQPVRKPRSGLIAAVGGLVVLGGALAVWQLAGPGTEPAPTDVPAAASDSAATAPDASVPDVPATGTVTVAELPAGGTITVAGRRYQSPFALPAGRHVLELRAPGFETKRVTVDVTAGERMTVIFAAQPVAAAVPRTPPAAAPPPAAATPTAAARTIAVGQSLSGTLSSADPMVSGRPAQSWTLRGTAGQPVEITLRSDAFDSYLYLEGPGLAQAIENDDGAGGLHSRITTALPATGTYTIIASALGAGSSGPYTLSVTTPMIARPPARGGTIALGQAIDGTLSADAERFEGRPVQAWALTVPPGTDIEINLEASFDTYLFLVGPGLVTPITDDDGGTGSNARIVTTLAQGGTYTILASAYAAAATGAYRLSVRTPATLATLPLAGQPLSSGSDVSGTLSQSSPLYDGRRVHAYELRATAGTTVTISVTSDEFDTFLYVTGPGPAQQLTNDDGGGGTNSRLSVTITAGGSYRIGVAGFSATSVGRYRLSIR